MPNGLILLVLLWWAPALGQEATPAYRLGPGDEVTLHVLDLEEVGRQALQIGFERGDHCPAGRPDAGCRDHDPPARGGAHQALANLPAGARGGGLGHTVPQPAGLRFGSGKHPGVFQIEAGKTLYQALSLAGGVRPDAGAVIRITRRKREGPIPLPGAELDPSGEYTVAEVLGGLGHGGSQSGGQHHGTARRRDLRPGHGGGVCGGLGSQAGQLRPGPERNSIVLQAVAKAEGLDKEAAPKRARILRNVQHGAGQVEVAINVKAMLAGKAPTLRSAERHPLYPLASGLKNAASRATEIAASAAAYRLISF